MLVLAVLLGACTAERRSTGPEPPQTPPNGPADARIALFEGNAYQLAQGGRYFSWYGCGSCHANGARAALDLNDRHWRRGGAFAEVYASITGAHPPVMRASAAAIPAVQLWQITAYVRSLNALGRAKRRRQDLDQAGEAQGRRWPGPVT